MSDQLTDREAEMMRVRGWDLVDGRWEIRDKHKFPGVLSDSYLLEGGPWWSEELAEVRDELRERSPYQQGFWDAEHGGARKNPFERDTPEWSQYERGLDDYWSAIADMNEDIDDYYNDNYEGVDE